jgi:hypothetical protein
MKLVKRYRGKTPISLELISDCLMIVSQSITAYAIFADNHVMALISLITGVLSKTIVRFIEENEKDTNNTPSLNGRGNHTDLESK